MNHFNPFSEELTDAYTDIIDNQAPVVWQEAGVDFSNVRVAAAMCMPHGRFRGFYHGNGLITLAALNENWAYLEISGGYVVPRVSLEDACGVLWHELGHHVVFAATTSPWEGLKAGYSTHTEPRWVWTVATAWKHFHPAWEGTADDLGRMFREKRGGEESGFGEVLARFYGTNPPPVITHKADLKVDCEHCGTPFTAQRSTARYCSAKCRVAASRSKAQTEHRASH